jgi:UDP-glucose 4-epimerase
MKIVITGAAGFIGPHVARCLSKLGHEIVLFDQKTVELPFDFVQGDLACLEDVIRATAGADAICHLGGVGDVYLAFNQPYTAAAANALGTANIMEAALRNKVSRVVYTSTWEVYGKPVYQPLDEQHPCQPDHSYSITKLAGEQLAMFYDHHKNVPVIGLRLGTAYGRGMRPNSVFSIFAKRAMSGEPLTIHGTGSQMRQFTHVDDVAEAFNLAVNASIHGEVFNVVSDEEITVRQIAEMVVARFPTELKFEPARAAEVPSASVSNAKIKSMLNWQPRVSFKDGLADLLDSYAD